MTKKRQDTRKRVTQNHRSKDLLLMSQSMTAESPRLQVHPVVFSFNNSIYLKGY